MSINDSQRSKQWWFLTGCQCGVVLMTLAIGILVVIDKIWGL